MGLLRYKIWSDLWGNKGRTFQVVLIIAMGAFAIGMIITTRTLMVGGMDFIWGDVSPATITLWTNPRVGDDTITALKRIRGELADAAVRLRVHSCRMQTIARGQPAC